MPCNSEHMAPQGAEIESRRVARFLKYLFLSESKFIPEVVHIASSSTYGSVDDLDQLTAILCEACEESPAAVSIHPDLSEWWEQHRAWDDRKNFQKEYVKQLGL